MTEEIPGRRRETGRPRRPPKAMTRARLERIALHHLDRYPSSVENLRRVLERRAEKSRQFHEGDAAEHRDWIEAVLRRLVELGHLDDDAYGAAVARRLRERGSSGRLITARLAAKGLSFDRVRNILENEDSTDADQRAARIFIRRRRLGPYRPDPEVRAERRQRDLAALARAGFSYSVASATLDEPLDEEP